MNENIAVVLFVCMVSILYSFGIDNIPLGLFTDEATIGMRAYELIHGQFEHFLNPFFYQHNAHVLGTLPIYTTAPFVLIFGLSEFSVRFASVFFGVLSFVFFIKTLQLLKMNGYLISGLLFVGAPLMLHMSRINWGMSQSFFLVMVGVYSFFYAKKKRWLYILSGMSIGGSSFGYLSYVLCAPVIVGCMAAFLFFSDWKNKRVWRDVGFIMIGYIIAMLPIFHSFYAHPEFLLRFEQKTHGQSIFTLDHAQLAAKHYPTYLSLHFLFLKGEQGLPGSFVTRHNIIGHGLLLLSGLPVIIWAYLRACYQLYHRRINLLVLPFFLFFLLSPFPDLLKTDFAVAPYSFAVSPLLLLSAAFISAYGIDQALKISKYGKYLVNILACFIVVEIVMLGVSYAKYPKVSADYWGWQWGAEPIMQYFVEHADEYDQLFLSGDFNEPEVFVQFYDPEKKCKGCMVGNTDKYQSDTKQLFAVRSSSQDIIKNTPGFHVLHSLYLPNGNEEFVIGVIQPE